MKMSIEEIKDLFIKMNLNQQIKSFEIFKGPDGYIHIDIENFSQKILEKRFKWHSDDYVLSFLEKELKNDKDFNISKNAYDDIIKIITPLHYFESTVLRAKIYNGKDFYITFKY